MTGGEPLRHRVVVVGAGVSGLAVSFELRERSQRLPEGIDLLCLEGSERPGGNIRSEHAERFLLEWGPNGFLDNAPATLTLIRRLGLGERVVRAREEAALRFVFRAGRLRQVPTGPRRFLTSDVLPLAGRLRVLLEPLIPARRGGEDESVFSFAARRIGRSAAATLVDAMVTGIYAGDSRQLSLPATFPTMREMEQRHGSLVRAMIARRRRRAAEDSGDRGGGGPAGPGGTLTSFHDGMQELTDALADRLGPSLRTRSPIEAVGLMGRRGFRIVRRSGAPIDAAAVVLACPARKAAPLMEDGDPQLAAEMAAIPSAPLAVVHFGYRPGSLRDAPRGFGFLVPGGQPPLRILGALWSSCIFEERAPDGGVLLTAMIGGARDPAAVELDDRELSRIVRRDFGAAMGVDTRPDLVRVVRHAQGIPQYALGHLDRVAAVERCAGRHPGLFVCGNSYRGVSVNACVEEAPAVAESVLEHLAAIPASTRSAP